MEQTDIQSLSMVIEAKTMDKVEELALKHAMDLSGYHDDNGYALDATQYVAVEGVRAALREMAAWVYQDAARICRTNHAKFTHLQCLELCHNADAASLELVAACLSEEAKQP